MQTVRLDIKNVKIIIFILAPRGRVCQKNAVFTAIGVLISIWQYISKMYAWCKIDDTKMSEWFGLDNKFIEISKL